MRTLLLVVACASAFAGAGCKTSSCDRDPDELFVPLAHNLNAADAGSIDAEGGAGGEGGDAGTAFDPTQLDGSVTYGSTYWSAPPGGPYAYFPPFRTITFEHDLGVAPVYRNYELAFSSRGTLATSAGNTAEERNGEDAGAPAVTAKTVTVFNNTCSEFYLYASFIRPFR